MTGTRDKRLAELVREARAAGELDTLKKIFRELTATSTGSESAATAPASDALPGRFGMIGTSPAMERLYHLLVRVAASDVSVLIVGETGTGKELVARALHDNGSRKDHPFMAENCAAVPAQLLESELFGHTKGSFTGALANRDGHFVAANGGTMFLDEIGDMPLEMQAKLLRVLEEREVRPVGSNKTVPVDVRLVAATHRDLLARCASGEFREDLLYRLQVVTLSLPALRDRPGDIALLARHFLTAALEQMGRET